MRIGFIHRGGLSTFMERDLEILRRHFDVVDVPYSDFRSIPRVVVALTRTDLYFSWFADIHSAIPALVAKATRKPTITVVGGYDAARVPEIDYGAFLVENFQTRAVRYALRHSTRVLVVDPSLKDDVVENGGVPADHIHYVPTGYDPEVWKPDAAIAKDVVLTVAGVNAESVTRKGIATFVETARLMPETPFVIVGRVLDDAGRALEAAAPPNVTFTGFVSEDELVRWYQRARVYCQLSRYEGLPNALCEGMLAGAVPVGTRYCGIPTAIGDTGFYVAFGDAAGTADAIRNAWEAPGLGERARARIADEFPKDRRERELVAHVRALAGGRGRGRA